MKLKFIAFLLILCSSYTMAQHDTVAITINNKAIALDELRRSYDESVDKDIDAFVKSYVDYKLIVEEALVQKLDTVSSFRRESSSTRLQISKLFDQGVPFAAVVEDNIYGRLLHDVDINHAFVPYANSEDAILPADTLKLYKEALKVRDQVVQKGFGGEGMADHAKATHIVADWTTLSGHLGWMIPFSMPMAVEDAMYSLPTGEVSMPIRSNNGYHIVQVLAKRPARGNITLEQVLYEFSSIPPSAKTVDSLTKVVDRVHKTLVDNPSNYTQLCDVYRKAKELATQDCHMGSFGLKDQFPPNFLNQAFELENIGDVSAPILTNYGIHLVRLKAITGVPSLERLRAPLNERIERSDRRTYLNREWLKQMGIKYELAINNGTIAKLQKIAERMEPSDSLFAKEAKEYGADNLLTIGGAVKVTVNEFIDFVSNRQSGVAMMNFSSPTGLTEVSSDQLDNMLHVFIIRQLDKYIDETMEERIPEFKVMMTKYNEGLLVYEAKNKNVWRKVTFTDKYLAKHFETYKTKFQQGKQQKVSLDDVRGEVEADAIDMLENKWIETLRGKYTVVVNDEVVKKLK